MEVTLKNEPAMSPDQREKAARERINNLTAAAIGIFKTAGNLVDFGTAMRAVITDAFNHGILHEKDAKGETPLSVDKLLGEPPAEQHQPRAAKPAPEAPEGLVRTVASKADAKAAAAKL